MLLSKPKKPHFDGSKIDFYAYPCAIYTLCPKTAAFLSEVPWEENLCSMQIKVWNNSMPNKKSRSNQILQIAWHST